MNNREDDIKQIAHKIWLEEGRPNGEHVIEYSGQRMSLKQSHWKRAEKIVECMYKTMIIV